MDENQITAQNINDEFRNLTEQIKEGQVDLTPDVKEYLHDWMEVVLRKVENGMTVTEKDMKFMKYVRAWIGLPKEWRKHVESIESLCYLFPELDLYIQDAKDRKVPLEQWIDMVLFLYQFKYNKVKGYEQVQYAIDAMFEFINGKIVRDDDWDFNGKDEVRFLAKDLEIKGNFKLTDCYQMIDLPERLVVHGNAELIDLANLEKIPGSVDFRGNVKIVNCPKLNKLPKNFKCKRLEVESTSPLVDKLEDLEKNGNIEYSSIEIVMPEDSETET